MNRARTSSRHLPILGALVFVGVPVAVACGGKVESLNGDGGATTATPSSSASSSPTATSSAVPTSYPTPTAIVSCPGQPPPSPAPCAVSFQQTIFPYMAPTGEWACTNSNCHGPGGSGASSINSPTIDGSDAKAAYLSLAQLTSVNNQPYINACSSDPGQSAFLCNLEGTCPPTMPVAGGGVNPAMPPSATSIENLKTWLACGAPFN
jgi:hypothetical protein